MLKTLWDKPHYTLQEKVTRKALAVVLFIMAVMPLPFCIWHPIGWVAYAVYLIPVSTGFYPLLTTSLKEKITFHCLIGISLILVALSILGIPQLTLPIFFVLLTLYLVYWQLEKRLFAIRRSLQEYTYEDMNDADAQELVKGLLSTAFKKALVPAAAGTLCCAAGLLPPFICGGVLVMGLLIIRLVIKRKQKTLNGRNYHGGCGE